jgi:hypothetical protein
MNFTNGKAFCEEQGLEMITFESIEEMESVWNARLGGCSIYKIPQYPLMFYLKQVTSTLGPGIHATLFLIFPGSMEETFQTHSGMMERNELM